MATYSQQLKDLVLDGTCATLELTPEWTQGRAAYGGWQAALALQAMRTVAGDAPLRSLQVNFIAPVPVGKVTARAELLRRGKSVTQVEARIGVDGAVAFNAVGIFGAARPSVVEQQAVCPAALLAGAERTQAPYNAAQMPVFLQNFQVCWGGGGVPYSGTAHGDAQVYLRMRDDVIASDAHLVCLADANYPSALTRLSAPVPMSSINWTLEFAAPVTDADRAGWFRFDLSMLAARDGYAWENAAIWSESGHLVAMSRQCVAVFG